MPPIRGRSLIRKSQPTLFPNEPPPPLKPTPAPAPSAENTVCQQTAECLELGGSAGDQCENCGGTIPGHALALPPAPAPAPAPAPVAKPATKKPTPVKPATAPNNNAAVLAKLNANFKAEKERQAIQSTGTAPHVLVIARAGTGKTWTMTEGLKVMKGLKPQYPPSEQQQAIWEQMLRSRDKRFIGVCAYNTSIAETLQERVPRDVDAMTTHRIGRKAVSKAFDRPELEEGRCKRLAAEVLGVNWYQFKKEKPIAAAAILDLVEQAKNNLLGYTVDVTGKSTPIAGFDWHAELIRLAFYYSIELPDFYANPNLYDLVLETVPLVLERTKDVPKDRTIDFDDMVWLPIVLNLPMFYYDLLLVDEAQDLNLCRQAIVKRAGKRLILVGDPRQSIYGFSGADTEAMERLGRELGTTPQGVVTLPLTVTRRCGKRIVAEAQQIVGDFQAHDSNPEGEILQHKYTSYKRAIDGLIIERPYEETYLPHAQAGDFILCRANAPLVGQCYRLLRHNKPAMIMGRDIGAGLVKLIDRLTEENNQTPKDALRKLLNDWLTAELAKENAKPEPSEQVLQTLTDKHRCIATFLEDDVLRTSGHVKQAIAAMFDDDKDGRRNCIKLSTIHKAKGLEADRVWVLRIPEAPLPSERRRMQEWERVQELNMWYVAVTRAKTTLVYVG